MTPLMNDYLAGIAVESDAARNGARLLAVYAEANALLIAACKRGDERGIDDAWAAQRVACDDWHTWLDSFLNVTELD